MDRTVGPAGTITQSGRVGSGDMSHPNQDRHTSPGSNGGWHPCPSPGSGAARNVGVNATPPGRAASGTGRSRGTGLAASERIGQATRGDAGRGGAGADCRAAGDQRPAPEGPEPVTHG